MSKVLTDKTKLIVKQICSLIAGVIVCIYIFIPLFSSLSAWLFLLVASRENYSLFLFTGSMLEAVGFCASGFLIGLIISFFSRDREIRTTMLGSLIVITFIIIKIGFIPFRFDGSEVYKAYRLLEMVVYAISLVGSATMAAWLVARRRHSRLQNASK